MASRIGTMDLAFGRARTMNIDTIAASVQNRGEGPFLFPLRLACHRGASIVLSERLPPLNHHALTGFRSGPHDRFSLYREKQASRFLRFRVQNGAMGGQPRDSRGQRPVPRPAL